jgi:solute carrier family 1 (high affinity glutamate transporter) protein 1
VKSSGHDIVLYLILVAIVAGAACGWILGPAMTKVAWLGTLFLNALKMLIVPLIASSMIVGISGLGDIRKVGRTGMWTLVYYLTTTGLAVLLGIILVNLIRPGAGVEGMGSAVPDVVSGKEAIGVTDILLSLVSPNIMKSMSDMDVLPIIVFSLIFGGILTTIGSKGKIVIDFFDGVNEAIMKMVHLIMYIAPAGIFALIASRLGEAGGGGQFWAEIAKIGRYSMTVLVGLSIHSLVVLPLVLMVIGRRNPIRYAANLAKALLTAFSTASSSATLPVTLECVQERNKVSRRAALFVLPVGATINMDGTALYESVAAIFIAQAIGHPLTFGHQVIIFLTATLAAVGAAGIPQAGLVTMVIVLKAVGLPLEGIGLILAVDWFLDRCRTTVNVWGDGVGAAVIDRLTPEEAVEAPVADRSV